jgi:hypothetical protein
MKFPARVIGALAFVVSDATAFAPYTTTTTTTLQKQAFHSPCLFQSCDNKSTRPLVLQSSTTSSDGAPGAASSIAGELSDEELAAVQDLVQRSSNTNTPLQELVAEALPTMHPSFIMKLRAVTESNETSDTLQVARALQRILDSSLAGGREVLAELLHAGEIRKLDAAIGKFARQGRLDMAFFQVLSLNLQDASQEHQEEEEEDGRSQILRHIYTRCQEEVEKTVPGGVALLNKLLRTEMESIRANQLEHYLCPRPNIITSPDGTEIELKGKKPVLVPPSQFMNAISDAVKQIRTVEKAGGTDKESAANLVESCRQVASEARVAIAKNYGVDSAELKAFEDGLMPVFRPTSPDSPYIQGQ